MPPKAKLLRSSVIRASSIERRIYFVRGQKVMTDTRPRRTVPRANRRVQPSRSPQHPAFSRRLYVSAHNRRGGKLEITICDLKLGRAPLPAFRLHEQGVAMLSSVLKSDRAIQVNIAIMRAFVKLREILDTHRDLAQRLEELELKYQRHDGQIRDVFNAIRALLAAQPAKRPIGFRVQPPNPK